MEPTIPSIPTRFRVRRVGLGGDGLDAGYRQQLDLQIEQLQRLIEQSRNDSSRVDAEAFHRAKQALDEASVRLHEIAIAKSLRGEN